MLTFELEDGITAAKGCLLARPSIPMAFVEVSSPKVRGPGPQRRATPASLRCALVKSPQQLAADTASPHFGVDKDHGHVAIAGDDRSSAALRAPGFSQCHRHHIPVPVEVTNHQARLWLGEFLPNPGHPVNARWQEPGDVGGPPDSKGTLVICRKPIENGQMHIPIVPALFGRSSR
jgi:hypothetical protein